MNIKEGMLLRGEVQGLTVLEEGGGPHCSLK